ncbi:MAG: hypothetical protein LWX01_03655 [Deltaproteobacteria bacterium]|nr:hypothetical protein [Deltaproteobacteria bacterium]MDL1960784.1 hypothetical protein [Deltaproteobacteria bacterium]
MKAGSGFISVITILILFLSLNSQAQEAVIKINNNLSGNYLETKVCFTNNTEAVAAQFDIVYDSDGLTPLGEIVGETVLSERGFSINTKEISPGRMRVIISPPIKIPLPLLPDGCLIHLNFSVKVETVNLPSFSNVILSNDRAERVGARIR